MKILVKGNNWITCFANHRITFRVEYKDEYTKLTFTYNNKKIFIKSVDLSKTFKYLEKIFTKLEEEKIKKINSKLVI